MQRVFWQFSRNNTYESIPGKLSEVHLYAWLFSNPCGMVLIIVGISRSLDLTVQPMYFYVFLHAYMGGCPSSNSGSGISKSCSKQDHSPWAILPGGMQEVPRTNWLICHYFAYRWPTCVIVQPFAFVALLLSLLANWVVTAERPLLQVRRIVAPAWAPVKHLQAGKVKFRVCEAVHIDFGYMMFSLRAY